MQTHYADDDTEAQGRAHSKKGLELVFEVCLTKVCFPLSMVSMLCTFVSVSVCVCACVCVFLVSWTQHTDMGEGLYYQEGLRALCKQGLMGCACRRLRYILLVSVLGTLYGGAPSVLLKMPFESTLLHFTCLPCGNSAYSWNQTAQSTKLHALPNRTGVGVCKALSPTSQATVMWRKDQLGVPEY